MQATAGIQSFKVSGFRPPAPIRENLGLIQPHRRAPMGQRAPFRPAHRPPMIASTQPKRMGGFWETASLTVALGAGGIGAIMLSTILPTPFKTIFQVGGVGLLAVAAINLMSGEAEAAATTEDVSASYPIGEEADFQAVTAKILSPSRGAEISRGLFSSDYDVQVSWANNSDRELAVPFQVRVEEKPEWGIFQEDYTGIAHTGVVVIPPRQVKIVDMEIPLKHRGFGAAMATAINLSLRKISAAGQGFEVANTSFVVY